MKRGARELILLVITALLGACALGGAVLHDQMVVRGHPIYVGMRVEAVRMELGPPDKVSVDPRVHSVGDEESMVKKVSWYRYGNISIKIEDNVVSAIVELPRKR